MLKASIMIVEDEGIVAADLQMTLQRLGYGVVAKASSGKEAVKLGEEYKPDLILMDILMPGEIDGIEAAGQIRARFDIPVIYVTAHADETIVNRAKTTEPFGYIIKPFNEWDIFSNIEMALYRHRMDKQIKEHTDIVERLNRQLTQGVLRMDELSKENERLKKEIEEMEGRKG